MRSGSDPVSFGVALWQPVHPRFLPRARTSDFDRSSLLWLRGDGTGVLFRARKWQLRDWAIYTVQRCDTRRPWLVRRRFTVRDRRLTGWFPDGGDGTIVSVPTWRAPWWTWALPVLLTALVVVASLTLVLVADSIAPLYLLLLAVPTLLATPLLARPEIQSLAQLPLDDRTIVGYAQRRLAGQHPEQIEEASQRISALARVNEIRERYARLQMDVVERIDHPALFDPQAPHTAALLAALVRAEDLDADGDTVALQHAAAEIEALFSVAVRHAQRVGIDHLPVQQRDDARRAQKVARLARDASSQGEREAALRQLNRILESLALYYLPPVKDVRELEP